MDPSSYTHIPHPSSRPSRPSHSHSHSHAPPRLGAISENTDTIAPDQPPLLPPRAHNRPRQRMFHLGFPPTYGSHGERTPEYPGGEDLHDFSDVKGPKGEDFGALRGNRHITKRGGWRRLVVIAIVILILVVGLGIGLGVGLSKNDDGPSDPSGPPDPAQRPQNQTFPLGTYTFATYLSTVLTSCTPTPATWSCFPYQTYNESSTGSLTSFNWIITSSPNNPTSSNPADYLISSSSNPFALTFTDTGLRLVDPGSENEALNFSVMMQKVVIPNEDITGDGSAARCLYNDTRFEAKLYTKRAKTYPPTESEGDANSSANPPSATPAQFQPWPYAVEMAQTIGSGAGVPDCYKTMDGQLQDRIGLAGVSTGGECECGYLNFGT